MPPVALNDVFRFPWTWAIAAILIVGLPHAFVTLVVRDYWECRSSPGCRLSARRVLHLSVAMVAAAAFVLVAWRIGGPGYRIVQTTEPYEQTRLSFVRFAVILDGAIGLPMALLSGLIMDLTKHAHCASNE
jgi:hypothetical protein